MIFKLRSTLLAMGAALGISTSAGAVQVQSDAFVYVQQQTCGLNCSSDELHAFQAQSWLSRDGVAQPSSSSYFSTPNGVFQDASATASLADSTIRVVNSGASGPGYSHMFSTVRASVSDTFALGGSWDPAARSRLSVDVSGLLATFGDPSRFYSSVTLDLFAPGSIDAFSRGDYGAVQVLATSNAAWGGPDYGSPATLQTPATVELLFVAPQPSFEWMLSFYGTYTISSPAQSVGVTMDLGNTLTLHFDAPQGALVSSNSGYLPAATGWVDPLPAVPEPGVALMWAAGLAVITVLRRPPARV